MTYKHGIKDEAEKETLFLYKPLSTIHHLNKRKPEIPKIINQKEYSFQSLGAGFGINTSKMPSPWTTTELDQDP